MFSFFFKYKSIIVFGGVMALFLFWPPATNHFGTQTTGVETVDQGTQTRAAFTEYIIVDYASN